MLKKEQNVPAPAAVLSARPLRVREAKSGAARLKKVQSRLKERNLGSLLISSPANRFYLTGWSSDAEAGFVLISENKAFIVTDSRYREHAASETDGFEIMETEEGVGPTLRDLVTSENLSSIGFESHHLSVFDFKRIKRFLKKARLVPEALLIEELRAVKDNCELKLIQESAKLADETFDHLLNFIKPELAELEVAWEAEKFMREQGAEVKAWDPFIVATGANSSMAHWGARDTKIKNYDMVLLDFGCVFQGYCSDISRVIFVGKPSKKQIGIYNLVLNAQKLGVSLVEEGRLGSTVDRKVRGFLEKSLPVGVDSKNIYRHALGHGVGLEIHELPSLSIKRKRRLVAGNVVTIEPGVYIPGWGGMRIEDMVLVTEKGGEVLTKAPKGIREVII